MKVNQAQIKFHLRTNIVLKNGQSPIVVFISYNGRKEKSTKFTCTEKYWDKKKECIKKGFPNYIAINAELALIKKRLIDKRDYFEMHNIVYTPSMILDESVKENLSGANNTFKSIMEQLIEERQLKYNTVKGYQFCYSKWCEFFKREDFIVNELTEQKLREMFNIQVKLMKEGTVKNFFEKTYSLLHYSKRKGYIDYDISDKFRYWEKVKTSNRKQALELGQIKLIQSFYLKEVTTDGKFKESALEALEYRHTRPFSVALFLIMYHFQGMAVADLARLKKDDFKEIEIESKKYYMIETRRQKTSEGVTVLIERDLLCEFLIESFLWASKNRNGYFLPIFQNKDKAYSYKTEKELNIGLLGCEAVINKKLKKVWELLNAEIAYLKETEGIEISQIPLNTSLYAARHSFASIAIQQGVNPYDLATSMGRSLNNISTYIKDLRKTEELIKLRDRIYKK